MLVTLRLILIYTKWYFLSILDYERSAIIQQMSTFLYMILIGGSITLMLLFYLRKKENNSSFTDDCSTEFETYKRLLKHTPRPTEKDINRFIEWVSDHHSWYKHLSDNRETPFIFYLDTSFKKSPEQVFSSFKIDPNTTGGYGNLSYVADISVRLLPDDDSRDNRVEAGLSIVDETGKVVPLPYEAIQLGTFMMSRFLHSYAFKNTSKINSENEPDFCSVDRHEKLISDLKKHISSMLDTLYKQKSSLF